MDRSLLVEIIRDSFLSLSVGFGYGIREIEIVGEILRLRIKLDVICAHAEDRWCDIPHADNFCSWQDSSNTVCTSHRKISQREVNSLRGKVTDRPMAGNRGQILDGTHAILNYVLKPIRSGAEEISYENDTAYGQCPR
jgi:hypothetical protein